MFSGLAYSDGKCQEKKMQREIFALERQQKLKVLTYLLNKLKSKRNKNVLKKYRQPFTLHPKPSDKDHPQMIECKGSKNQKNHADVLNLPHGKNTYIVVHH